MKQSLDRKAGFASLLLCVTYLSCSVSVLADPVKLEADSDTSLNGNHSEERWTTGGASGISINFGDKDSNSKLGSIGLDQNTRFRANNGGVINELIAVGASVELGVNSFSQLVFTPRVDRITGQALYAVTLNYSNSVLDNVLIHNTNGANSGTTSALSIQQNSPSGSNVGHTSLSARTVIISDHGYGVELVLNPDGGSHVLNIKGSTIAAKDIGVLGFGAHTGTLVAHISSATIKGKNGVLLAGGFSTLTLSGGVTQGEKSGLLIEPNAAGDVLTATISRNALITATDVGGAGLILSGYGDANLTSGTGVSVVDSRIQGDRGILLNSRGNLMANDTQSRVSLSGTQVSGSSAAIEVGVGKTHNTVTLANGTTLSADSGVAVLMDSNSEASFSVKNAAIIGDFINNGRIANLTLGENASWTGTFTQLSNLTAVSGGTLILSGASSVAENVTNSGTIALGNGLPGNQLTVGGNYTGNNGTLLFRTGLGADDSVTDKLVVNGNTSGTTKVRVTNAGGSGARTLNGIELIQVNGDSAGSFTQAGRIAAGAWDYTLVRGSGARSGNFYLTSQYVQPPPEPAPTPVPAPAPSPTPQKNVLRPEGGSYAANLAAGNTLFITSLHDRLGETHYVDRISGQDAVTSLWLRQTGTHAGFHDGSGQLKTQSNSYVAQLGGDVAQWTRDGMDRWHLGVSGGYASSSNTSRSSLSGYGSRGEATGYSAGLYATWLQNDADKTGAYADSWAQYNWFTNHVNGDGLPGESYRSSGIVASLESGYTFAVGEAGPVDNPVGYFVTPQAQAIWMGVAADDHTEHGGTRVTGEGDGNIQTRLGIRAFMKGRSRADVAKVWTFAPYVEANWLHNTDAFGSRLNGVSVTQAGTANVGELKVGVEARLTSGTQLWGNIGQQLGDKGYNSTTAMAGVIYTF